MKKLRVLSLALCITMLISIVSIPVYAEEKVIEAYITISSFGEIVKDKNGDYVAESPVTLSGKESYTLDDVFKEAHNLYYDGGADAGYATAESQWGLSIAKAWGDTSGKFGYQINLGAVYVMGLTQEVNDGDYIDLAIYENYYPDTENYAIFNTYKKTILGKNAEIALSELYYSPTGEMFFKPCPNAKIVINGAETEFVTNADGKCILNFEKSGKYLISAKKTKTLANPMTGEEYTAAAITAPVCILEVVLFDDAIIHNIVNKTIESGLSESDQMYWFLADIAGYYELYPDSEYIISDEEKQKCLDIIISKADETESAGDLAKAIMALRSMGYDAENVYNNKGIKVDIPAKLSALIDKASPSVTSVYTLPYVIIAMQEYLTEEKMATLINAVLVQKDYWQDTTWGVDGITPILLALAPYCDKNIDVKNAVLESVNLVTAMQSESGAITAPDWINGGLTDSAASTGLAVTGFSAIGIAPETFKNNGKNLIDGLLSLKTAETDGFLASSFDTEQGLRGLIEWKLSKEGKRIYDFSSYPKNEAHATIIFGDVDGDGAVNTKDNAVLARHLAGWTGYEEINFKAADTDNNGKINAKDNAILARHLADWTGYEVLPVNNTVNENDVSGTSGGSLSETEKKN